jgi:hypothetical protein
MLEYVCIYWQDVSNLNVCIYLPDFVIKTLLNLYAGICMYLLTKMFRTYMFAFTCLILW